MAFRDNKKKVDLGLEHFVLQTMNEHERNFFFIRSEFVPNLKELDHVPVSFEREDPERKFMFRKFVALSLSLLFLTATAVTPKFYARHDTHEGEIPEAAYVKAIEDALLRGPKERRDEPETENQRYGWDVTPLIPLDKSNKLLNHYHKHTPITIVAADILMATRNLPKDPPFTGTPFKL